MAAMEPDRSRRLTEILPDARAWLDTARRQSDHTFILTGEGMGLTGYPPDWVGPLFAGARNLPNIHVPDPRLAASIPWVDAGVRRVIVAGSRRFNRRDLVWPYLDRLKARWADQLPFEVVCGEAPGVDSLGLDWAMANGHPVIAFPAPWQALDVPCARIRTRRNGQRYNAEAGMARNAMMAAYATHLCAFWDQQSPGTRGMIDLAKRIGLAVWWTRPDT